MAESRWNEFWGGFGGKDTPRAHPRLGPDGKPLPVDKYDQWGYLGDALRFLNSPSPEALAKEAPPVATGPAPALVFAAAPGAKTAAPTDNSALYAALDAIAPTFGGTVTSATRSAAHNSDVGGVPNSYHLTGLARDLVPPPGMTMAAYGDAIRKGMPGWDVLDEGNHIHVEPGRGMNVPTKAQGSPWQMPQLQAPDLSGALAALSGLRVPTPKPIPTNTPVATSPHLTPLDKATILGNFDGAMVPDVDPAQFAALAEAQKRAARLNPLEGTVLGSFLSLLTGGRAARVDADTQKSILAEALKRQILQSNQRMTTGQVGANVDIANTGTANDQAKQDASVKYQNDLAKYNAEVAATQQGNANNMGVFGALMQLALARSGLFAQQATGQASAANQTIQGQNDLNLASISAGVGPAAEAAGTASGATGIKRDAANIAAVSGVAPGDQGGTQAALGVAANQPARVVNAVANDMFSSGLAATLLDPATYQALLATAAPKDAKGKPLPAAKVDQKALRMAAGQALAASMLAHPEQAQLLLKRAADAGLPSAVAAMQGNPQVK